MKAELKKRAAAKKPNVLDEDRLHLVSSDTHCYTRRSSVRRVRDCRDEAVNNLTDPCRARSEVGGSAKTATDSSSAGCVKNEEPTFKVRALVGQLPDGRLSRRYGRNLDTTPFLVPNAAIFPQADFLPGPTHIGDSGVTRPSVPAQFPDACAGLLLQSSEPCTINHLIDECLKHFL